MRYPAILFVLLAILVSYGNGVISEKQSQYANKHQTDTPISKPPKLEPDTKTPTDQGSNANPSTQENWLVSLFKKPSFTDWAIAAFALATAIVGYKQWKAMQDSVAKTQESLGIGKIGADAARDSAIAAMRSAKVAEDALANIERPLIYIRSIKLNAPQ
jgi:hypothetical protein